MTTYEYLTQQLTDRQVHEMTKGGIISAKITMYMEIYAWHYANGRNREKTAQHFGIPAPSIGYAIKIMRRTI